MERDSYRQSGRALLRLKYVLSKKNVTETELAALMDTSLQYVNKLANGHGNPSIETLDKLAEKLDVGFLDLFAKGNRPLDEFECPHCGRRLKVIAVDDD